MSVIEYKRAFVEGLWITVGNRVRKQESRANKFIRASEINGQ